MKLKNKLILLCATITTFITIHATDPEWVQEKPINHIAPFTHAVLNHYYIIARLKKTITLLKSIPQEIIELLPFSQLPPVKHDHIVACINHIKKEKSVKPLFKLWNKITTYRFATDNQCISEFTALVYTLLAMIKEESASCNNDTKKYCLQPITATDTNAIAFRFFLLRRLHKTHVLLKQCKNCLLSTKKINFVLHLFDMFNHYHDINNPTFIKKFLQLIFVTTQTLSLNDSAPDTVQTKTSLNTKNNYHELLNSCTIEEILNAIDDATINASMLIGHHAKKNVFITFKKLITTAFSTINTTVTTLWHYL
jgi:hypothetical protein